MKSYTESQMDELLAQFERDCADVRGAAGRGWSALCYDEALAEGRRMADYGHSLAVAFAEHRGLSLSGDREHAALPLAARAIGLL